MIDSILGQPHHELSMESMSLRVDALSSPRTDSAMIVRPVRWCDVYLLPLCLMAVAVNVSFLFAHSQRRVDMTITPQNTWVEFALDALL